MHEYCWSSGYFWLHNAQSAVLLYIQITGLSGDTNFCQFLVVYTGREIPYKTDYLVIQSIKLGILYIIYYY